MRRSLFAAVVLGVALATLGVATVAYGAPPVSQSVVARNLDVRVLDRVSAAFVYPPIRHAEPQSGQANGAFAYPGGDPGPVVAWVSDDRKVHVSNLTLTHDSVVATVPVGQWATLAFTSTRLFILMGTPSDANHGFFSSARLYIADPGTGVCLLHTTFTDDVSGLSADFGSEAYTYVVSPSSQPGTEQMMYTPGTGGVMPSIMTSGALTRESPTYSAVSGGHVAYNEDGQIVVRDAKTTDVIFRTDDSLKVLGVRAAGRPALLGGTLAWTQIAAPFVPGGAILSACYVRDLPSGLTAKVSEGDVAIDGPGPALTRDSVFWTAARGKAIWSATANKSMYHVVGGGASQKTIVQPHVFEQTRIRESPTQPTEAIATLTGDDARQALAGDVTPADAVSVGYDAYGFVWLAWVDGAPGTLHVAYPGQPSSLATPTWLPSAVKFGSPVTLSTKLLDESGSPVSATTPASVESTYASSTIDLFHCWPQIASVDASGSSLVYQLPALNRRTVLRFVYPGDAVRGYSESALVELAPIPRVSIAVSPAVRRTTSTLTFSGRVRPDRMTSVADRVAGSLVIQRLVRGRWVNAVVTNAAYVESGAVGENPLWHSRLRLRTAGSYRARLYVAADDYHAATSTVWLSFAVR